MGLDINEQEIQIISCPLAKFAVSFAEAKGDYIGRKALLRQFEAFEKIFNRDFSNLSDLPRMIKPVALSDKGVARSGFKVFKTVWK